MPKYEQIAAAAAASGADEIEREQRVDRYDWGTPPFPKFLNETVDSMAEIGEAFMERMPKGYNWMQSPAEVIDDLTNERDEALELLRQWVAVVDLSGVSAEDGAIPDNPSMNPVTELLRKTREATGA